MIRVSPFTPFSSYYNLLSITFLAPRFIIYCTTDICHVSYISYRLPFANTLIRFHSAGNLIILTFYSL